MYIALLLAFESKKDRLNLLFNLYIQEQIKMLLALEVEEILLVSKGIKVEKHVDHPETKRR